MSSTVENIGWGAQPLNGASVDWSNPITQDLRIATLPDAGSLINIVNGSTAQRVVVNSPNTISQKSSALGRSFSYDGDYHKFVGSNFNPNNDFTIITLFNHIPQRSYTTLFGVGSLNDRFIFQIQSNNTGLIYAYGASNIADTADWSGQNVLVITATASNIITIYKNGVSVASGTSAFIRESSDVDFVIGDDIYSGNDGFNGDCYTTLVFNRLLTDSEIQSISKDPYQIFTNPNYYDSATLSRTAPGASGALVTREILLDNIGQSAWTGRQILIRINAGNFEDFAYVRSDGADIRFTDSNNNALNFWMKSWDYANSIAEFYVKMDLTADAVNSVNILYGDNATPTASSYSNTMSKLPTLDSSYLAAWTFDEGSGSTSSDQTGNGNTATLVGSPTWVGSDGGMCGSTNVQFSTGSHISLNGSSQYITCGTVLDTVPDNGTIAFWFQWGESPTGYTSDRRLMSKVQGTSPYTTIDFVRSYSRSLYYVRIFTTSGTYYDCTFALSILDDTNWHYIEILWGAKGFSVRIDDVVVSNIPSFTGKWGNKTSGLELAFGVYNESGNVTQHVKAKFDCITVQNVQRTIGAHRSAYNRKKYVNEKVVDIVTRSVSNPILSATSSEWSGNCTGIFEPTAVLSSDGSTVHLYYTAIEASTSYHAIYHAYTSAVNFPTGWTKTGRVVGRGTGGESNDGVRSNIFKNGTTWYLYYCDQGVGGVNANLKCIVSTNEGSTWGSPVTVIAYGDLPTGGIQSTNTRIAKKGSTFYLINEVGYSSGAQWRLTLWTASDPTGPFTYVKEMTGIRPGGSGDSYSAGSFQYFFGAWNMVHHASPTGTGSLPSYLWHLHTTDIVSDVWTKEGEVLRPLGTNPPEYDQTADAKFFELNNKAYIFYSGMDNHNFPTINGWVNVLTTNVTLPQLFEGPGAPYGSISTSTVINGQITLTGQTVTGYSSTIGSAANGTLSITGQAPTTTSITTGYVNYGQITLTGYAPSVSSNATTGTANSGAIELIGYSPTGYGTGTTTGTADYGCLSLTGYAPTLYSPGSGTITQVDIDAIADAVWAHSSALLIEQRLLEAWGRLGLDPTAPLITGKTTITFGDIIMAMTETHGQVTVTRQ